MLCFGNVNGQDSQEYMRSSGLKFLELVEGKKNIKFLSCKLLKGELYNRSPSNLFLMYVITPVGSDRSEVREFDWTTGAWNKIRNGWTRDTIHLITERTDFRNPKPYNDPYDPFVDSYFGFIDRKKLTLQKMQENIFESMDEAQCDLVTKEKIIEAQFILLAEYNKGNQI